MLSGAAFDDLTIPRWMIPGHRHGHRGGTAVHYEQTVRGLAWNSNRRGAPHLGHGGTDRSSSSGAWLTEGHSGLAPSSKQYRTIGSDQLMSRIVEWFQVRCPGQKGSSVGEKGRTRRHVTKQQ